MKIKFTKVQLCFIIAGFILLLAITGITSYYAGVTNQANYFHKLTVNITDFADCVKSGYPVLETFPAQCKTSDGRTFTELVSPSVAPSLSQAPIPASNREIINSCTVDSDCTIVDTATMNTMSLCCQLNRCTDYSKSTVQAVSRQWLAAQKTTVCGNKRIMCPMIAMMCTRPITESQRNYQAKCVHNTCQKLPVGQ